MCDVILLQFDLEASNMLEGDLVIIGTDQLRVEPAELPSILQNTLTYEVLMTIGNQEGWAIELVERRIAEYENIPQYTPQTRFGEERMPDDSDGVSLPDLFEALLRRQKWIAAFELSARHFPEQLPRCVEDAGEAYFDTGQFASFWREFSGVAARYVYNDDVLYWYYSAALAQGQHQNIVGMVQDYLRHNDAPRLRGLLAASFPSDRSLYESERAYRMAEDCYTLKYYGYCLLTQKSDYESVRVLRRALYLAEQETKDSQVVDIGNKIGESLIRFGEYRTASAWAVWALDQCYERRIGEELRKLEIQGTLIFCGLLLGHLDGIGLHVERIEAIESSRLVPSLVAMISTLGDYYFVVGQLDRAIQLYDRNVRSNLGPIVAAYSSRDLVRALVAVGEDRKAIEIASRALSLARGGTNFENTLGHLSLGSALSRKSPREALPLLESALSDTKSNRQATWAAQASLHLAKCHIALGNVDDARSVLSSFDWCLRELGKSGWRLFGGPEELFRDVWLLYHEDALPLELTFLGGRGVRVERLVDALPLRWCEILTLLALHPEGLSGEQLALMLYGDDGNQNTLKSTLSRLRRLVPISSRPYRIGLPFSADFVEIDTALREGRLREALEMYRGPLLEASQAPGIVEARVHLEEALREAVLMSGDAGPVVQLARRLKDDLEVWERAERLISRNDPQYPLVRARVRRIRREWGEA